MSKAFLFLLFIAYSFFAEAQPSFVRVKDHQFILNGKPYYYIGTNYWYAGLLGLEKVKRTGIERLRKELDFLKANGVVNLRIVAGAEGTGLVNGVQRIGPALQTEKGVFNESVLKGLDILLHEIAKRDMKAILFLSNNWEWSGGFLQYLHWNNRIPDSTFRKRMDWDELRDEVSKFYVCTPCKADYLKQVNLLLTRINTLTKKKYRDDPAIMSWELANEPRPMRPVANEAYVQWIQEVAAFIKSKDKNHLVTLGHEGNIGVDRSMPLFEKVHALQNIDYLTIHIWPKNWSWFTNADSMETQMPQVLDSTIHYINTHIAVAQKLKKPLVIEEFGLPRDGHSFDIQSGTALRDRYYDTVFGFWQRSKKNNGVVAGANFWAFGGTARPIPGQAFWKVGDAYMGDPPMEEQGLNTVFDSDTTTWRLIRSYAKPSGR